MTTWYSRSRRVSNSRDDNASLSTHVPNCWRCSSVSLLGAPLRGRSGKLAKPDFSHLRRRTRTASRHSLCCSATDCTLYPAASNKIVSARSRSRQSAPFLMISIRHSRSLSSNSIGATRATALSSVHIPECREFTANQLVAKCLLHIPGLFPIRSQDEQNSTSMSSPASNLVMADSKAFANNPGCIQKDANHRSGRDSSPQCLPG